MKRLSVAMRDEKERSVFADTDTPSHGKTSQIFIQIHLVCLYLSHAEMQTIKPCHDLTYCFDPMFLLELIHFESSYVGLVKYNKHLHTNMYVHGFCGNEREKVSTL